MSAVLRKEAAELLFEARELVEMATRRLNTETHTCESCGANRAVSWTEAQAALELAAVGRKIQKWRRRLMLSDEQLEAARSGEVMS